MDHARHVADLSLALFDALAPTHRLPTKRRRLLETAAIVHNIGLNENPAKHHTVGRDLILAERFAGHTARERDMVACTTRFHRKKVRPNKEPAFVAMSPAFQRHTLAMAALLRVADGLDYSQTQTTKIVAVECVNGTIRVTVAGEHAVEDAARAMCKADLWNRQFDTPLECIPVSKSKPTAAREPSKKAKADKKAAPSHAPLTAKPGLLPHDPVVAAAQKVMRIHFDHLLANEAGTRAGRDIEALHQMRVASRRLRAVLRCFGPYLPRKQRRRLRSSLRRMTKAMGPVRDLDVHLQMLRRYRRGLPEAKRVSLDPLLKTWRSRRKAVRNTMFRYLDGKQYEVLKRGFQKALRDPADEADEADGPARDPAQPPSPRAGLLRHIIPAVLWKHYERVRAYETVLDGAPIETIHALRIDCKRLRYALELVQEVLGQAGQKAIEVVKQAQSHLGDLHDADVACAMLRDVLEQWRRLPDSRQPPAESIAAVADYRTACETDLADKLETFPAIWNELTSEPFRRLLGEATATP